MTRPHPLPAEPAPILSGGAGSAPSDLLAAAADEAERWAGGALAVIVSGSHARGEARWCEHEGRALSLSDVDLYVVVRDRAAQAAAEARMRRDLPRLAARARAWGLAAPLEAAFLTPEDLATLPARPGTVELARHGVVLRGDPSWLARVPGWTWADVGDEELRLLIENRAFELIEARLAESRGGLEAIAVGHALAKVTADARNVVDAWGRRHGGNPVVDRRQGARGGDPTRVEASGAPASSEGAWREALDAWAHARATVFGGKPSAPAPALRSEAARAPWRRRLRGALEHRARSGAGPSLFARLRRLALGTPQHRVNATGAALALALVAGDPPRLDANTRRLLAGLGVVPPVALDRWEDAAAAAFRAWDRWLLDGQRTAEAP